jgi:hypothetical protein
MTFVPFEDADSIGGRFLGLLTRLGIQPPQGSALEGELLSLTQLIEVMKNPNLSEGPDQVAVLRPGFTISLPRSFRSRISPNSKPSYRT